MSTSSNLSVTQEQTFRISAGGSIPVLVLLGGAPDLWPTPRIVRIEKTLEIGRNPSEGPGFCLRIRDGSVSSHHAHLTRTERGVEIRDLGSQNGTYIGLQRIGDGGHLLTDGDLLFFGSHAAVYRILTPAELTAIEEDRAQPLGPIPTASGRLALAGQRLREIFHSAKPVLLYGPPGVGKEIYGRAVHASATPSDPFVVVSCECLPRDSFESKLLGSLKGNSGSSPKDRSRLLATAQKSTLFLDQVEALSSGDQEKLLGILHEQRRLGEKRTTPPVRIIISARAREPLRDDLLASFGPAVVRLPDLVARREDIASLAAHFLKKFAQAHQSPPVAVEAQAFFVLCLAPWGFNVRELEDTILSAATNAAQRGSTCIRYQDLPYALLSATPVRFESRAPVGTPRAGPNENPPVTAPGTASEAIARVPTISESVEHHAHLWRLTPRETEILPLETDGLDAYEIASRLGISSETVHTHRQRISAKAGGLTMKKVVALVLSYGRRT